MLFASKSMWTWNEEKHFAKVVAAFEQYGPYAVSFAYAENVLSAMLMN